MTRETVRTSRNAVIVTAIVIVVIVAAFLVWLRARPAGTTAIDLTGQPVLGAVDAPVQVVVFEDFKCPSCKRFDEEALPQIRERFVDTGQVRYAFVNFPFLGPDSRTAALAAECVTEQDPELFWPYKDLVFRAQRAEGGIWATPRLLVEVGSYVPGVNVDDLRACIAEERTAAAVDADLALVRELNVNSTPTVYVNGERVEYRAYQDLFDAVAAAAE